MNKDPAKAFVFKVSQLLFDDFDVHQVIPDPERYWPVFGRRTEQFFSGCRQGISLNLLPATAKKARRPDHHSRQNQIA